MTDRERVALSIQRVLSHICADRKCQPDTENACMCARILADAAIAAMSPAWRPMWRHKKRGTVYMEIGRAELQDASPRGPAEGDTLVIYQGDDGKLWAREVTEFEDGRFEPLPAPPAAEEG